MTRQINLFLNTKNNLLQIPEDFQQLFLIKLINLLPPQERREFMNTTVTFIPRK